MVRRALLFQKLIAYSEDDIVNEEREYLSGAIPFRYLSIKRQQFKEGKFAKEKNIYVMKTQADIDFKAGDAVKVGNILYSIMDVEFKVDPKHQAFLERNPNATERFTIKELLLRS